MNPSTSGVPALSIRGLRKAFHGRVVVNDLWLDVPAGSFLGLLGPNGAGKTTTLSMCVGLLRPDAGAVSVFGHDVWSDPVRAKAMVGVLPDGQRLFDRLTARELLTYHGLLRGMDRQTVAERAEELIDVLTLGEAPGQLIVDYSAGMKKKIGLACALLHAPRLLVLDEPFESIDPVSVRTIRQLLHRCVEGGATVVISSHVLPVVETHCDRVAIIHRGMLAAAGSLQEVRGDRTLEDVFVDAVGAQVSEGEGLGWLRPSSVSS